jgi:hypothetical protein
VYVDGVAQSTTGSIAFTNTATDNTTSAIAAIGSQDDGSVDYFDGQMDDVRIYSRALTAAEVKQLYQLGGVKIKQ